MGCRSLQCLFWFILELSLCCRRRMQGWGSGGGSLLQGSGALSSPSPQPWSHTLWMHCLTGQNSLDLPGASFLPVVACCSAN